VDPRVTLVKHSRKVRVRLMTDLKRQLKEDKAIRSAARSILLAQIAQVRHGLSGQRIGEKLAAAVAGAASVVAVALAWKPLTELFATTAEEEALETDDDASTQARGA
jgi:hypothetical protein